MTGDLVEPSLDELGVIDSERLLDLVSKTQVDPAGDNDQFPPFGRESCSIRKRNAHLDRGGCGGTKLFRHRVLRETVDGIPAR